MTSLIFNLLAENAMAIGIFPFGEPVNLVKQQDSTRKRVFILGVYASAVHAELKLPNGKTAVKALAVASEPYIFWRGDNAQDIISKIKIPQLIGELLPANEKYNGPSGKSLDNDILAPLFLSRDDAWLCDLVPYSCMNKGQEDAINRVYLDLASKHKLPLASTPKLPKILVDNQRAKEIEKEILDSGAEVLIPLGDQPIKWFIKRYDKNWNKLSDFGIKDDEYGKLHTVLIGNKSIKILPLAHPRQISKLGLHSNDWFEIHQRWINKAPKLPVSGN